MSTVLVVANETLSGPPLLEAMRQRSQQGDVDFYVVVPRSRPRHGNIVFDEVIRDAAQLRLDLALSFMHEEGIKGDGEVGDPDPYNATLDALAVHPSQEIIVSTLPVTASGWMKRDLVERLREHTELPVEHIVFDVDREGYPFDITLVAANLTVACSRLLEHLRSKIGDRPRRFLVIVPQDSADGRAVAAARERLRGLLDSLAKENLIAAGTIGNPDPYEAIMNELELFPAKDIVISTLPEGESSWLKQDLIERVRSGSGKPVDHVISESPKETAASS